MPQRDGPRPAFKFDIENAFTADCAWAGVVAPAHLDGLAARQPVVADCNVYAIARRPRLTVVPSDFVCDETTMTINWRADWGDGEPAEVSTDIPNLFGTPVSLTCEAPFTNIRFESPAGDVLFEGAAWGLLSEVLRHVDGQQRMDQPDLDGNLLDLDVVYVGQSLDVGGATERRLLNHSTLQEILSDTIYEAPHLDVFVILMAFTGYTNLSMFGGWQGIAGQDASEAHLESVLTTPHTERDIVALVEAALIRYFQPRYNEKFKNTFPRPLHTSYRRVYELDYNAVGFEFESLSTLSCRLKSDVVEPSFIHSSMFPLHDEKERRAFFDVFDQGLDLPFMIRPDDRPPR